MENTPANPSQSTESSMLEWGKRAENDYLHIKEKAVERGLDPVKLALGFTLRIILGDDGNSFAYVHTLVKDVKDIKLNQQNAVTRLTWEAEVVELPQDLREELKKLSEQMSDSNWASEESFNSSKGEWSKMSQRLEERVAAEHELSDALNYYDEFSISNRR